MLEKVKKVALNMRVVVVGALLAVSVAAIAEPPPVFDPGSYDLSTEMQAIPGNVWSMLQANSVGLFVVLTFFVALGLVLRLLRKFGAKPAR